MALTILDPDRVVARYDYIPAQPNCIPLTAGRSVFVYNRHPSGWWDGASAGARGWFPSNYVCHPSDFFDDPDEEEASHLSLGVDADAGVGAGAYALGPSLTPPDPATLLHQDADERPSEEDEHGYDVYPSASSQDISRIPPAMADASCMLEAAARARNAPAYIPCAGTVVTTARDTLEALGCLRRHDPVVNDNPEVAARRKQVYQALKNLVAITDRVGSRVSAIPQHDHASTIDDDDDDDDLPNKDANDILTHSRALTASLVALVDATPPVLMPHRQTLVRSLSSLRAYAEKNRRYIGAGPARTTRSSDGPRSSFEFVRQLSTDGPLPNDPESDPTTQSQSLSWALEGDAAFRTPSYHAHEFVLIPPLLEDIHGQLVSALSTFRTAVWAHSRAATNLPTAGSEQQQQSASAEEFEPGDRARSAGMVTDIMDATLQTHKAMHKLVTLVERLIRSPSFHTTDADAMAHLVASRDEVFMASSHFLASVRSVTAPELQEREKDVPDAESQDSPVRRSQAQLAAMAAASALAAGSALSRAMHDTSAAALALVAQHEDQAMLPSGQPEEAYQSGLDTEDREPHSLKDHHLNHHIHQNFQNPQHHPLASEIEEKPVKPADFPRPIPPDFEAPSRTIRHRPSSDRAKSRLSLLTRKVTSLNMLRTTPGLASLTTTHRPRSSSSPRTGASTTPNTPATGYMTPNDALDSAAAPSSPATQLSRNPFYRLSGPSSHESSPASSTIFQARNGSVDALIGLGKRISGLPVSAEGLTSPRAAAAHDPIAAGAGNPLALSVSSRALSSELDTDELVRNTDGDVLGGTLDGLLATLAPSRDEPCPEHTAAFALTMRLFSSPESIAYHLHKRFSSAPVGPDGDVQRANAVAFARLWLSDMFWRPTDDQPAIPVLIRLAREAGMLDLEELAAHHETTGSSKASMRVFSPSPGRIVLRRVIGSTDDGAEVEQLYARPWVPSGAGNPSAGGFVRGGVNWAKGGATKLTDVGASELARQLTILASRQWSSVTPEEFLRPAEHAKHSMTSRAPGAPVDGAADRHDRDRSSSSFPFVPRSESGLPALSALSNRIVGWVAQSVLMPDSTRERRDVLKHFIKISQKCLDLNNLHVFFALQGGLASASIRRLTRTWNSLPAKYSQWASEHAAIVDPGRNYVAYRHKLSHAISVGSPCIPFIGLVLTDLTFTLEGNAPMRRASGPLLRMAASEAMAAPNGNSTESDSSTSVINWVRYARAAKIVHQLTSASNSVYALQVLPEMQSWLLTTLRQAPEGGKPAHDERLYRRSLVVEPRASRPPTTPSPKPSSFSRRTSPSIHPPISAGQGSLQPSPLAPPPLSQPPTASPSPSAPPLSTACPLDTAVPSDAVSPGVQRGNHSSVSPRPSFGSRASLDVPRHPLDSVSDLGLTKNT